MIQLLRIFPSKLVIIYTVELHPTFNWYLLETEFELQLIAIKTNFLSTLLAF